MQNTPDFKLYSTAAFRLTPRSVLIGLIGVTIQCLVTPYNDFQVGATYLAGNHLPIAVVFTLTIFVLVVNVALRKVKPSTAFNRPGLC